MADHNELGKWGETVAMEYLVAHGYAIEARDVRIGRIEVDIIARIADRIVFVEVKTRRNDYVDPEQSIDRQKQRRLIIAADSYIRRLDVNLEPQFDLIFIIGTPETGPRIEHIQDAFYPTLM